MDTHEMQIWDCRWNFIPWWQRFFDREVGGFSERISNKPGYYRIQWWVGDGKVEVKGQIKFVSPRLTDLNKPEPRILWSRRTKTTDNESISQSYFPFASRGGRGRKDNHPGTKRRPGPISLSLEVIGSIKNVLKRARLYRDDPPIYDLAFLSPI